MTTIELNDDEVIVLHNLIVHALHEQFSLPPCTWEEECVTCNLYNKAYDAYEKVRKD